MKKIENINTIEDMQQFVEGCVNDLVLGLATPEETTIFLRDYTLRILKLSDKSINQLSKQIFQSAVDKGFHDRPNEIGTSLMLCVSELSEALEADRENRFANLLEFECRELKLEQIMNESYMKIDKDEQFKQSFEDHVKDTFEDEIADAIIRLLDLSASEDIDIERHIMLKIKYNKTRVRLHGKKY